MASFRDTSGKEWIVKTDPLKLGEVLEETGIDLGAKDGKGIQGCIDNAILTFKVLWVLCRSQAGEMTPAEFSDRLADAEVMRAASDALADSLLATFLPGMQSTLRSLSEKQASIQVKLLEMAKAKVDDPNLEAAILKNAEAEMDKALAKLMGITTS